ncbi:helix-turn-helix domain-containing protein [Pseudoalteromonas prydzensis]|uniref:helix-turn-helix domain-containing protein n=1 Tax=Pseudoalteromonas prydzensis TaxID=182141 RepID=UPI0007E505A3|nr:helix-turn-helix domain-containing protein [Pseudoalteromonas prydzensis]MBE0379965.1 AraC family transcriptional regulator, ethanolamine operon transcriptional activator [Pseudoalteromonas prydzensis ACAM 620]
MQHNLLTNAPTKCTLTTTDVDQQADNLTNWQQKYDQVSDGCFYGCIDEVAFNDLQVFKEFTQRALRQQCKVWPNALWLGIPAHSQQSKINGLSIAENQLMCRPSDCNFELITPEQFNIYGMVINQDALQQIAQQQGLSLLGITNQGSPRITTSHQAVIRARQCIEQVIYAHGCGASAALQHDILLNLVLQLLQSKQPQQKVTPSYKHRKLVVDRAKEFIVNHPDNVVTITQLCEFTYVCRRTLQYSFETILGINPLRFLRITRLNQIRRELSDPQINKPIATVAANWGFWHPGQFAKDYKQLFGENPSQTLKRAQLFGRENL